MAQYLRRLRPDFALLQQTHLLGTNCAFIGRGTYKLLVHAGFTSGSRGVAILVKKKRHSKLYKLGATWEALMLEYVEYGAD